MPVRTLLLSLVTILISIAAAFANHPGENIDVYMKAQEKYFQPIDLPNAPLFELLDADGNTVRLSEFKDKVVVLNFIFTHCRDVCPLHAAVIADIQQKINITPLKSDVQFITITTDPVNDTPDVMKQYGKAHGFDPTNWLFLTIPENSNEATTRALAEAYNVRFEPVDNGQQMHGVVTHIIDKGGRFAAKFHGLKFGPVNLVLYISGLIDNEPSHGVTGEDHHNQTLWEKIKKLIFGHK